MLFKTTHIFRRVTKAFTNNYTMQRYQCTIVFIELMEVCSSFVASHLSLARGLFYVFY